MATYINLKLLDKLVIDYQPPAETFIAEKLLTPVPVQSVSDKYAVFAKYSSGLVDDQVGFKSTTGVYDVIRVPSEGTYACTEHALKDLITEKQKEAYGQWFDLVKEAAFGLKRQIMLNREYAIATLAAAASYSTTPSTKWDAASGVTIEADIRDAVQAFKDQCGIYPNTIVIPQEVWNVMVMDSTLRDVWTLIPNRKQQDINLASLIGMLFDIPNVLVPNIQYATTGKGATESLSSVWTDNVYLVYVAPRGTTKTFTWAANFIYRDWNTRVWDCEDPEGQYVKVSREDCPKEVCSTAIYALTNVLT